MKKISNFIDLKKFDNRLEAEAAAALLRVNKIECIIFADDCGGMEPRMHLTAGVRLQVKADGYETSHHLLG